MARFLLVPLVVVLAVLAVLAALAVLAVGRGDGLPDAAVDRAPLGLPEGPLDPDGLDRLRFSLGFRGYRMDQVDEVLDRCAAELARCRDRIAELEAELHPEGGSTAAESARSARAASTPPVPPAPAAPAAPAVDGRPGPRGEG